VITGKIPASPSGPYGVYQSVPRIINHDRVLTDTDTDTDTTCIDDAFPVCPNTKAMGGSESGCPCTDQSRIRVGGVLHGVTSDLFWDPVFAAAESAAKDFNVDLDLERFEEQASVNDSVDGIFVTIPSDFI
jgi:hypothetical protein